MASDSADEIAVKIREAVEVEGEAEIRRKGRDFATEVMEYAKSISPFDPDDDNLVHYRDSFKVRARNLRGKLPSWRISNDDKLSTIIEDGSGPIRPQGGFSEPHFVFARTAFHFGGTPDHGIAGDDE